MGLSGATVSLHGDWQESYSETCLGTGEGHLAAATAASSSHDCSCDLIQLELSCRAVIVSTDSTTNIAVMQVVSNC